MDTDELNDALDAIAGEGVFAPLIVGAECNSVLIDGVITLAQLKQVVELLEQQQ